MDTLLWATLLPAATIFTLLEKKHSLMVLFFRVILPSVRLVCVCVSRPRCMLCVCVFVCQPGCQTRRRSYAMGRRDYCESQRPFQPWGDSEGTQLSKLFYFQLLLGTEATFHSLVCSFGRHYFLFFISPSDSFSAVKRACESLVLIALLDKFMFCLIFFSQALKKKQACMINYPKTGFLALCFKSPIKT